jgi:ATP-binding cassette subfamily F protein uup
VSKLSGGERRRLYLMTVLMQNPNFLILDEPTNDLDLITLNRLEDFLMAYGGVLIVVSHDRYFMDKLADHLFIFEGDGNIRDFNGSYSEYRDEIQAAESKAVQAKKEPEPVKAPEPKAQAPKKKLSYKETQELARLEGEIASLETEKSQLVDTLQASGSDYVTLEKATQRMQVVTNELDEKTLRWLELSELAE